MIPAVLLLMLALAGPLQVGAQAFADGPEVTELRFEGNESFSDEALANAIVTRETECRTIVFQPFCWAGSSWAQDPFYMSGRFVGRDVARLRLFYYQRGYRETTVDTVLARPSSDEVQILFRIREGRPVRVDSLAVLGLEEIEERVQVARDLPVGGGAPLSGVLLDATRDSLRNRLQNRGYAHAEVLRNYFIPRDDPYSARVSFQVYPGPRARIGELTVVGNQAVSESVVRRMLPFSEGDLYRQEQIFDAQRSLYNLDIFRYAEIRPDLGHTPDSVVPLTVQVNESDVHQVRAGAGWNNADCLGAESRWASRNFFGGARRLQFAGRLSNVLAPQLNSTICNESGTEDFAELNWRVSTEFTQPWLFSSRNSFTASVYGERQSLKDVFIRNGVGATVSLTRSVGRRQNVTLGYQPQLSTLEAAEIFFCTSFLVCEPEDIAVLAGANWLSPLTLGYSHDRSNQVLNPTRGYTFQVELEHASELTGSEFAYNRIVTELDRYWPVAPRWILAGRVRVGWLDPNPFGEALDGAEDLQIVHPQKRFFAGGSNSVRGFAQNQLGPRNLSVPVGALLRSRGDGPVCTPEEIRSLTCDAGGLAEDDGGLLDDAFTPRPTGGSQLFVGNVELRFPLWSARSEGAIFLDVGQVWSAADQVDAGDLQWTPGIGFRYFTPVGPVRVDLSYQLEAGERLQVVTTQIRPRDPERDPVGACVVTEEAAGGELRCVVPWVPTDELAILEPPVEFGAAEPWSLGRLQLHFSIGQAF